MKKYTGLIKELKSNEYIVIGTNTEGRHGAGLALKAKIKWGAIYGRATGFIGGKSYGIVTKDLNKGMRSISLEDIVNQILELFKVASLNPDKVFYLTPIGCGLGGYKVYELNDSLRKLLTQDIKDNIPNNIIFDQCFNFLDT